MTIEELRAACESAVARGSKGITLVLPGYSAGNHKRLFGRSGPLGEVVADTGDHGRPESLVCFDPGKVLAYLDKAVGPRSS